MTSTLQRDTLKRSPTSINEPKVGQNNGELHHDTNLRAISPAILSSITAPETYGTSDCFGISHDCVIEETTLCRQSKVGLSVVRLSLV